MKKKLLVTSLALLGGLGVCATASAVITGSKHDFATATGFMTATGQICLPCHAPHNNKNALNEVLWNHDNTTQTFVMYDSPTLDGLAQATPQGVSKFCLSCHDGVTAIDAYTAHAGSLTIQAAYPSTTANLGVALSNDHPISIKYDPLADVGGLNAIASLPVSIKLFGAGADQVECGSCHDVHNKYSLPKLVNVTMVRSELCLECHSK
ncbi:MAG: cytochrome c3 family protein [Desulfocapsaceae bacterium]|nr:cytochrome c3 family protein [Desulfocapsaceae bacterium]